ncbi:MAG: hypothetical protein R3359_09790 [Marinirhabdus sp.]|nr:hypothetical protein [Marinirhabdus sp.]
MKKILKLFDKKNVNYIAIIISILTLVAFIYQTSVISQQQHMSVYPHLMLQNQNGGSLNYSYTLTNKGVGPAIIESFRVTSADGKMYDDLGLFLLNKLPEKYHEDILISNVSDGQLISSGEEIELFAFNHNRGFERRQDTSITKTKVEPLVLSDQIYTILNDQDLKIEILYKSVYNDRWHISNTDKTPSKVLRLKL